MLLCHAKVKVWPVPSYVVFKQQKAQQPSRVCDIVTWCKDFTRTNFLDIYFAGKGIDFNNVLA